MRTFIAIEIPEEIKKRLAEAQALLKKSGAEAGWTRLEGIHLTLKFLGEVPETKTSEIAAALTQAMEGKSPFRLKFSGAGVFPHAQKPRVVWVGASGELDRLMGLQIIVEEQMVRLGFTQEDRFFQPHLTLGRIKSIRSREAWLKALDEISSVTTPEFEVTAISVMKSELKPTGAVYTEIGRVELK
jgi:2'-5' RNA ligase